MLATRLLSSTVRKTVITPVCSMYDNPYVERHKKKREVSEEFPKKTTALTGLFVNEHPHHSLKVIYSRILRALQQIPASSAYRVATEEIVQQRLKLVEEEPDMNKLEEKIGMGQLEEVIQQAEYELETCREITKYKAWEPLVGKAEEAQWRWPIS
ncbi:putative NADH dehydrogenase [ubiquinone] 1 alpha subcomplex subunit 5 [Aphelenchoides besseyi]|nr:putative NADH dehydrogenase [ubiquinone] 1 alpha subcomplex subunit 5 [Aphelenchoides besseyi]